MIISSPIQCINLLNIESNITIPIKPPIKVPYHLMTLTSQLVDLILSSVNSCFSFLFPFGSLEN